MVLAVNVQPTRRRVKEMKITRTLKSLVVALSCVGLLSGQLAQAASPIQDVALQPGGRLVGQVVDEQARPQAATRLAVVADGEAVAVATTDQDGRFEVQGLKAGVYVIQTADTGRVYRAWAADTAPPAAVGELLVVNDGTVVRGLGGGAAPAKSGGHFGWLANPWVLAGIVAAAIAIPLAVANGS